MTSPEPKNCGLKAVPATHQDQAHTTVSNERASLRLVTESYAPTEPSSDKLLKPSSIQPSPEARPELNHLVELFNAALAKPESELTKYDGVQFVGTALSFLSTCGAISNPEEIRLLNELKKGTNEFFGAETYLKNFGINTNENTYTNREGFLGMLDSLEDRVHHALTARPHVPKEYDVNPLW